jgi:hypothetical protein
LRFFKGGAFGSFERQRIDGLSPEISQGIRTRS